MEINIQNENIRKFMEKLAQDQDMQAKFYQLRDPDVAYKLASSLQEGFTKDEFITEMKRLYEETTKDLSPEDLEKVAGGVHPGVIVGSAVSAVSTVGAIIASGSTAAAI